MCVACTCEGSGSGDYSYDAVIAKVAEHERDRVYLGRVFAHEKINQFPPLQEKTVEDCCRNIIYSVSLVAPGGRSNTLHIYTYFAVISPYFFIVIK